MATVGYMAFGTMTEDIILLNMPVGRPLSIAAKFLYCFTIIGSFLVLIQPVFNYVDSPEDEKEENNKEIWNLGTFIIKRVIVTFTIFGLGQVLPALDVFLEIAGSVIGVVINIIIPAAFYNRAYSELHIGKDDGAKLVVRSQEFDEIDPEE